MTNQQQQVTPRRRQLQVGQSRRGRTVTEFKVGKNVQVVHVRCVNPEASNKWRQRGTIVELKEPYAGAVDIDYHVMEYVPVAAYFPLT